jgi:ribosome-associated heat shock protein Hsp15
MDRVRIDVWLDVACLFKTRSEAQRACNGGKVEVNDQRAKPHRELRLGETLTISRPGGNPHPQSASARTLRGRHPAADARGTGVSRSAPPRPADAAAQRPG